MRMQVFVGAATAASAAAALATAWIAFPTDADLELTAPLQAWSAHEPLTAEPYVRDFAPLAGGFGAQIYRSFCGPASIATVLRAYGVKPADQTRLFPTLGSKLNAFYTGMTLSELVTLAEHAGLRSEIVYANTLSLEDFRKQLKENLARAGDFVLVNYDRRVLKQSGAGHISPVGAYDEARDAFLVLDEAAYKYPFTWIPAPLLYSAVRTRDGDRFRGVLFIRGYDSPD